jgi:hypothetical protein
LWSTKQKSRPKVIPTQATKALALKRVESFRNAIESTAYKLESVDLGEKGRGVKSLDLIAGIITSFETTFPSLYIRMLTIAGSYIQVVHLSVNTLAHGSRMQQQRKDGTHQCSFDTSPRSTSL